MPTNNAKGLEEVLGLLGKATSGEWYAYLASRYTHVKARDGGHFGDPYVMEGGQRGMARTAADGAAIVAAVNYLRSHGEAIRELVEAAAQYEAHPYDAEGVNIAVRNRLRAALRQVEGR